MSTTEDRTDLILEYGTLSLKELNESLTDQQFDRKVDILESLGKGHYEVLDLYKKILTKEIAGG